MTHSLYRIWCEMHSRCSNKRHPRYKDYGGRGIKVCLRWHSFSNFVKDVGARPSKAHSLDRKNNDGNYTPKNCHWATPLEQNRNSRHNVLITANGRTQPVTVWAEEKGCSKWTLYKRQRYGWTDDEIINTPVCVYSPRRKSGEVSLKK